MQDETVEDQNELIELIEEAGWSASRVELSEHEYRAHDQHEVTRASIEILVTQETDRGFESPYRVKLWSQPDTQSQT